MTGREEPLVMARITANLSRYGLTTETSVEQFWESVFLLGDCMRIINQFVSGVGR